MLAIANLRDPLFWALMIAWIMSVVLHEFAHGLVGYLGGDYTIRERGGLTLNPLQYIDPVFSILLPVVFLAMGGIPLPGGSTYIRRDLIRSKGWNSAVSLAGPATNLILAIACAVPLHPRFGWLDVASPTSTQLLLGAMSFLQLLAVVLNLCPVPPLDGFQALAPWLPPDVLQRVGAPQSRGIMMIVFFVCVWNLPVSRWVFQYVMEPALSKTGYGWNTLFFPYAVEKVLFGS